MTSSHTSESEPAPAKGLPLRFILIVPFLVQVFLAVGLTGYLSIRNGRQAVNDVATQLRQEVVTRIHQKLDDYLADPHLVNRLNRDAVSLGYLDPTDLEALNRQFFYQAKLFPTVESIFWGSETEQFIGTSSFNDYEYQRMEAGAHLGGGIRFYAVDQQGNPTELLSETPNFPIRDRPWYSAAVKAGKPTWGEVFTYHAYPIMAIPASVPVYDEANNLIGVFGSNFFLEQISDFLKQTEIGQSGQTFIIERSGLLVASSTLAQPFLIKNGRAQRINVFESNDPLIREIATFLRSEYQDLNHIYSLQQLTVELNGERQFLQIDSYRDPWGLDWLVVVIVPESDFMEQIIANRNRTVLLCLLALVVSAGAGIFTSRCIVQSLTRLTQAADAIADGKLQPQLRSSRIREFQFLTQSFQRMAQQIQTSLALLESRVAERTASLAQTNQQLQQSEQRYRAIIEDQTELICRYQLDGTITFVNQAYCRYFNKTEADLVGQTFLPLIPTEDIPAVQEIIHSLSAQNPYVVCEHRVIRPDGSIRWQQWHDRVILDDAGQVVEYQGVGRDITAQKQAEAQLLEKSNTDQAMAQIVDRMRRSLKVDTILQDTTTAVRQVFKCDRAAIYQFNPDWSGIFVAESVDPAYPCLVGNGIQTIWSDRHLQTTQGGCFQKGDIHQANDTRFEIGPNCYRQMLEQFDIRAYIIAPVFQQNRLWGLLAVYQHQQPRTWTTEEGRLITHVGKQLGIALHQADLLIQVQQKSEELQRASEAAEAEIRRQLQKQAATANAVDAVVDRTRAFLDVDTIFSTVTYEARKLLNVDCVAIYQFKSDETGEFVAESIAPNRRSLIARQSQDPTLKLNIGDRKIIQLIHNSKPYFSRPHAGFSQAQSPAASDPSPDFAELDELDELNKLDETAREIEHLNQALAQVEQKFSPPIVDADVADIPDIDVDHHIHADRLLRSQFAPVDDENEENKDKKHDLSQPDYSDYWVKDAYFSQSATVTAQIESFVADDVYNRQFSDCYLQALEEYQIRAYIIAPIFQGTHLWGMLTAYQQTEPRQWEPWEVKAMIRLGKQLGIALRQAEYVREIREKSRQVIQALQAEAVMRQARDAADASNRAKSEFLSHMSHELRTPLNAILGFTQLMQREANLPDSQREYLNTINQSGEHLLTLINDILDMSKIEAGRLFLHDVQFDLHDLLLSIQNMLQAKAAAKDLAFKVELAPDLPQFVIGDEGKLRQILINLLGNAIKFTTRGSVTLRVQLDYTYPEPADYQAAIADQAQSSRAHANQNTEFNAAYNTKLAAKRSNITDGTVWFYFAIQDTGPGIPPEEVDLLFKPFMQTAIGRSSHVGTGLGLTISQKFAQIFGGDIRLESTSTAGSTFAVRLPLLRSQTTVLPTSYSYRCPVALAPGQAPCRILVVDDHDQSRQLMVTLLTKVGFQVEEATNGQEAIEQWYRWRPHLIWMDMRMPVMSGDQAAAAIKSQIDGQATIIIALTASAFEEERSNILAAGCDDFVRKPFQDWLVFEKMAEYLGVQYEYAPETEAVVALSHPQPSPGSFDTQCFAQQSTEWLTAVHQAATSADGEQIQQLVCAIAEDQPELAAYLNLLVQNFEFEAIIELSGGYLDHD
ncbi:MAG: GAF domain-containing protein [Thainema sp.]